MSDLKERFWIADDALDTPDLWTEARRRAATTPGARPLDGRSGTASGSDPHRVITAAVAFAVFVAAAVFAWDLSHPDDPPLPPSPAPLATVDLAAELGSGWTELPAPPEVRTAAATAWTGSQLLVWGGYQFDGGGDKSPWDEGFAFDGESRTWSRMPVGPLSGRSDAAVAWTGEEFLIWGGFTGECCEPSDELFLQDGAAYNPSSQTWRPLPAAPLEPRAPFSVWTGEELIVWGSSGRELNFRDGAGYDPVVDSWRRIAEAPFALTDATTVWTGDEMIVFGSNLDGNNRSDTPTAIGAGYDPATDTWRELSPSDLSPQAHTAGWPGGGEMIAWDYEHGTAAYDPFADMWRRLNDVPLRFFECYPQSATIPGHVIGDFCGQLATYSETGDRWREVTREDVRHWLIEPAAAGSAFLLMAHSLELSEEPNITFDTRMFAYVPPVLDRTGDVENPAPLVPTTETTRSTVRVPVVFPDGSSAALSYPVSLDLATLGIQPDVSYVWRDDPPSRYPIVFLHDPNASIVRFVDGTEPVGSVNSDRNIEIWKMSDRWEDLRGQLQGSVLRLRLRSWTVLVALESADAADRVAADLDIQETAAGFPVVEASGPLDLAEGFGESEGATLSIGDATGDPETTSLDATIFLSPDGCSPGSEISGTHGSSCLGDGNVFASIYGDRAFVSAVVEGVRVENFRPG